MASPLLRTGRCLSTALPLVFAIAAAATASSCTNDPAEQSGSSDGFEPAEVTCTPDEESGCMCVDGRAGTQVCGPSGHELSACVCDGGGDTGEPSADTGDSTDTGEPTGGSLCGNGVVDDDEQCDDANSEYDDACNNECIAECGLTWEQTIDRGDGSFGLDVAVGPDNSVAVVGIRPNAKDDDIWLARFDGEGTELWSETLDLGADETGQAVAVDADGNIAVTATVQGDNGSDIAVFMFNADGVEQWNDIHDGLTNGDDLGVGAAFDGNGNVIVSGTVRDGDGDTDLWLRKYDADGASQWTETYTGPGNGMFSTDRGGDVSVDGAGNVYVLADVYVAFDESDVHLLKFGPGGGAPLWDFAPFEGAPATDHAAAGLGVTANGDAVMGINNTVSTPQGWRYWVLKVDTDGNEQWQVDSLELLGEAYILDGLGVDGTGRVGLATTNAPPKKGFLAVSVALQADGTLGCSSTIPVESDDLIQVGGTVDPSGNLVVTGQLSQGGWLARVRGAAVVR